MIAIIDGNHWFDGFPCKNKLSRWKWYSIGWRSSEILFFIIIFEHVLHFYNSFLFYLERNPDPSPQAKTINEITRWQHELHGGRSEEKNMQNSWFVTWMKKKKSWLKLVCAECSVDGRNSTTFQAKVFIYFCFKQNILARVYFLK